jgi:hypothetical protein
MDCVHAAVGSHNQEDAKVLMDRHQADTLDARERKLIMTGVYQGLVPLEDNVEARESRIREVEIKMDIEKDHMSDKNDIMVVEELSIKAISISIINDAESVLTPILDYDIDQINLTYDQGNNTTVGVSMNMEINYFNPFANQWEPLVENTGVHLESKMGHQINGVPTNTVTINIAPDIAGETEAGKIVSVPQTFSINISTKAVEVLLRVQSIMQQKDRENELRNLAIKEQGNYYKSLQNVQAAGKVTDIAESPNVLKRNVVGKVLGEIANANLQNLHDSSPYVVVNWTGYPIRIREYKRTAPVEVKTGGTTLMGEQVSKTYERELSDTEMLITNSGELNLKPDDNEEPSSDNSDLGDSEGKLFKDDAQGRKSHRKKYGGISVDVDRTHNIVLNCMRQREKVLDLTKTIGTGDLEREFEEEEAPVQQVKTGLGGIFSRGMFGNTKSEDPKDKIQSKVAFGEDMKEDSSEVKRNLKKRRSGIKRLESQKTGRLTVNKDGTWNVVKKTIKVRAKFAPKMVMDLVHPNYSVTRVVGLNLEHNYSKRIGLSGQNPIVSEFSLVCTSMLGQNFRNILYISSPIMFHNVTDLKITVKILHPSGPVEIEIPTGQRRPAPFDCIDYSYQMQRYGQTHWTEPRALYRLYNAANGAYHQENVGTGEHDIQLITKVTRDPVAFQRMELQFMPLIKIKNCLPFPMKFRLTDSNSDHEQLLLPRQENCSYNIDSEEKVELEIVLPGFHWSNKVLFLNNSKIVREEPWIELMDYQDKSLKSKVYIRRVDPKKDNSA